ncbi:hypothetical protein HMPREF3038_02802 [Akkermansia sp. KLE1797]|nr:hypothetical protein HMPREF3038_02802 [Akkermansia sp. KLE1797]KXU53099.1 hypothetical protein HMPREF3039_02654 [Akkermansia sp. KLE1798]KZA03738.1 hypothetical protein HMPREF1326_02510 [Akkermansia sp. KLE1605]
MRGNHMMRIIKKTQATLIFIFNMLFPFFHEFHTAVFRIRPQDNDMIQNGSYT